jgi:hypothetical protein
MDRDLRTNSLDYATRYDLQTYHDSIHERLRDCARGSAISVTMERPVGVNQTASGCSWHAMPGWQARLALLPVQVSMDAQLRRFETERDGSYREFRRID